MNTKDYLKINEKLQLQDVKLVAISKTKPVEDIKVLYELGQRVFGENRAQEMKDKYEQLPKDIEWHMVGHLQTNKVKYIASFVDLIHSIDSLSLLQEVNKRAAQHQRKISVLLQVHIAKEENKYGFSKEELFQFLSSDEVKQLQSISIVGLMGMATFTEDENQIKEEFSNLASIHREVKETFFASTASFTELSMGMSGDYELAIQQGATMVRLGSLLFGAR